MKALGERNDIIKTMHRALAEHGLERGAEQYVTHGNRITQAIVGRVIGKGLAGDEMGERLHLIIDGVDGRTHYVETADAARLEEIKRGRVVALDPIPAKADPKPADRNVATMAEANGGIYRPSQHRDLTREITEQRHGDPDSQEPRMLQGHRARSGSDARVDRGP